MQLRQELERKIEYVNDKVFKLLEQQQQQILQQQQLAQLQQQQNTKTAELPASSSSSSVSQQHLQQQQQQMELLQQRLNDRIAELEAVNGHLIEHNMTLIQTNLNLQHAQQPKSTTTHHADDDNASVFSIDRTQYESQINQLGQQSAVLERQVNKCCKQSLHLLQLL